MVTQEIVITSAFDIAKKALNEAFQDYLGEESEWRITGHLDTVDRTIGSIRTLINAQSQ